MGKMGKSCIVYNHHKRRFGRMWSTILQVRVNFACYYRMPKDWIRDMYMYIQQVLAKLNET